MSNRAEALKWWQSMTLLEKMAKWSQWQNDTNDHRKKWPFALVTSSSSTIETIYNQLNQAHKRCNMDINDMYKNEEDKNKNEYIGYPETAFEKKEREKEEKVEQEKRERQANLFGYGDNFYYHD